MIIFYPYKMYSGSLKLLLPALGQRAKKVYPDRNYRPRIQDIIINWGNGRIPNWQKQGTRIWNPPLAVAKAINKLKTFDALKAAGVSIPEYTTSREEAQKWLNDGTAVVGRSSLTGYGGRGIVLYQDGELAAHPLYVRYKKKRKEFRVHVFNGEVIDILEKRKRNAFDDMANANKFIRSYDNGWVFCRENVVAPAYLKEQSVAAIKALELDFGGVDVIWNERENKCYVLEVNTAPGIEGTSVEKYAAAINAI